MVEGIPRGRSSGPASCAAREWLAVTLGGACEGRRQRDSQRVPGWQRLGRQAERAAALSSGSEAACSQWLWTDTEGVPPWT